MTRCQYLYSPVIVLIVVFIAISVIACGNKSKSEVDALNDLAYRYHYRNIDSTEVYAQRALQLADGYADGKAEAMNNLAFVSIAKMQYSEAKDMLDKVKTLTDNHIELLVSEVQMMRLCQRQSENKDFYHHCQRAQQSMQRIGNDKTVFTQRQQQRLVYALTEYAIVLSTYLYYMGQSQNSKKALEAISPSGEIVGDTAQLLAYTYNVGSGGYISAASHESLLQQEFDYLMRCYLLSRQCGYHYWTANSLQALSEHIRNAADLKLLSATSRQELDFLNSDDMPDSLLAGNLANRALTIFEEYGDVYQTAGAWRTLSEAYFSINDYSSALICLNNALQRDSAIFKAPDLVASIREQLSIVYSAMDNKRQSDYNRNIYLDLQERTRQDRQLEARAEQLDASLRQLDMMIWAVVMMIVFVASMLVYFGLKRNRHKRMFAPDKQLMPLNKWIESREYSYKALNDELEDINANTVAVKQQVNNYLHRNIEQRAKVFMASTTTPLISRMIYEVNHLSDNKDSSELHENRLEYVKQLALIIDSYNKQLTHWIKLRQGDFMLHVESFALSELFDMIAKSKTEYLLHGVILIVKPTDVVVKADRTLTLFMINTIAENARRFTSAGGVVSIEAVDKDDCIEIIVADTGCGMSYEQQCKIFSHNAIIDNLGDNVSVIKEGGHGFGLLNCKGIIEKYHKLSAIFKVCKIGVESNIGQGSRFFFTLPKGMKRKMMSIIWLVASVFMLIQPTSSSAQSASIHNKHSKGINGSLLMKEANCMADSVYESNVKGQYHKALTFADSCLTLVNKYFTLNYDRYNIKSCLKINDNFAEAAAELKWYRDSVPLDYDMLLYLRNEVAVAALALHNWDMYAYNNAIYTSLFRECSADNTLASYVRTTQRASGNRTIAIALLVVLFVMVFPAYYLLYYRHRMYYHLCVCKISRINDILQASDKSSQCKLREIDDEWNMVKSDIINNKALLSLDNVVCEIRKAVNDDVAKQAQFAQQMELASDALQRAVMDRDKLYISNNVLDNCLSTLKHETMYYPSRILQVLETNKDISAVMELADYYCLLYTALVRQATYSLNVVQSLYHIKPLFDYLLSILKNKNKGMIPHTEVIRHEETYITIAFIMPHYKLTIEQAKYLFTPLTSDFDMLVCCQVMRDIGELTGERGCGINAELDVEGQCNIKIKTTTEIWRNSKL